MPSTFGRAARGPAGRAGRRRRSRSLEPPRDRGSSRQRSLWTGRRKRLPDEPSSWLARKRHRASRLLVRSVSISRRVRHLPAEPAADDQEVPGVVEVLDDLMAQVALEVPHVAPNPPCHLGTGGGALLGEPGLPDDEDGHDRSDLLWLPVYLAQVGDGWLGAEFVESTVGARGVLRALAHHRAPGVFHVPKGDRLGRACLHARWHDIAVPHGPPVGAGVHLRSANALDTEGALLHHARAAYGDVGVELEMERRGPVGLEPVEASNLVGTIVVAVPRPDATIVHLTVQALFGVVRREDRADGLAGCMVALLAEHG